MKRHLVLIAAAWLVLPAYAASNDQPPAAPERVEAKEKAMRQEKARQEWARREVLLIQQYKREQPRREKRAAAISMEMVPIKGGCYRMGNTKGNGETDELPAHDVCVKDFALGKFEVTQWLWRKLMGGNPSDFGYCGADCPVDTVSWDDIQEFLRRLNSETGQQYRLPTEAEWEYACRAGRNEEYCGSGEIDEVAWYADNSGTGIHAGSPHAVGGRRPNALGLHDMSGNLWEWVQDCWHDNYNGAPNDGSAWEGCATDGGRVLRGGSWSNFAQGARAANRTSFIASGRGDSGGFRLARTPF